MEESNYIKHAKRELKALGYDLDDTEEGPNKWIAENLFELLNVFAKQGHSGGSAPYCANLFKKLALFEPLCPITGDDSEWVDVGRFGNDDTFQNARCSAVFKQGKDGKPYYLDAIVWRTPTGSRWTGSAEEITSRQYIKLPFTPKTFVVDVDEYEDEPGNWRFVIKDRKQLEPVFEYYEPYNVG